MKLKVAALAFLSVVLTSGVAKADNLFTQAQLTHMTQLALQDYATIEPDMAKSVSGFKVMTAAPNVAVLIYMNADGMNMTAKYLCVAQDADFACHFQN